MRHTSAKLLIVCTAGALLAACGSSGSSSPSSTSSSSASGSSSSSSGGTIALADIIAYTGASSFEGVGTDSGTYPAVYAINQAGGILGHKVTILPVDTRGDPADAVPAVEKMLATNSNVKMVSGVGTNSSPTIEPILNKAHLTVMSSAGNSEFNQSNFKYFWRLLPPDTANGVAMALWGKHKGYTRVATLFGTDASAQGDLPGVLAGLKATGAKVVAQLNVPEQQPSYQTDVAKLMAAHPQAIYTETDGATAATFFGQLKQAGGLVPIIGDEATTQQTWQKPVLGAIGAADFLKYVSIVAGGVPHPSPALTAYDNAVKHAGQGVQKPVNQWLANPFSEGFYDGVIIEALAMQAAHSTNPVVYNNYITKVTEPGPGKTVVYSFAQGKKALAQGKSIQYYGASGPVKFDQYHNSYGGEAAESFSTNGTPTVLYKVTASQIQAVPVAKNIP